MKSKMYELVENFRNAIEKAKKDGKFRDTNFARFPVRCCGDCSDLLGEYLLNYGFKTIQISGSYKDDVGEQQSHAWLVYKEWIIDITADQFRYNNKFLNFDEKVFVGKDSRLHSMYLEHKLGQFPFTGINNYSHMAKKKLLNLYEIITSYINKDVV